MPESAIILSRISVSFKTVPIASHVLSLSISLRFFHSILLLLLPFTKASFSIESPYLPAVFSSVKTSCLRYLKMYRFLLIYYLFGLYRSCLVGVGDHQRNFPLDHLHLFSICALYRRMKYTTPLRTFRFLLWEPSLFFIRFVSSHFYMFSQASYIMYHYVQVL